jgi:hypothetical protein
MPKAKARSPFLEWVRNGKLAVLIEGRHSFEALQILRGLGDEIMDFTP